MADMPVAYGKAKCCGFCRSRQIELRRRFLRVPLETPWCSIRLAEVELTYHCSRFRYAAGCRPAKRRKALAAEALPAEEESDG